MPEQTNEAGSLVPSLRCCTLWRCNPPIPVIHLIVQHRTRGGHFSRSPAGDQQRMPWSSGVEHPCNFFLGNKVPVLFLLRGMQNPFLKPPPNVGIQWKLRKHLGGIRHCAENLESSPSLDLLPCGFPELLPCFFVTEKRKRGYPACFLYTVRSWFPTAHPLLAPISIFMAVIFLLGEGTPRPQDLQILWHIPGLLLPLSPPAAVSFMKWVTEVNPSSKCEHTTDLDNCTWHYDADCNILVHFLMGMVWYQFTCCIYASPLQLLHVKWIFWVNS